MSFIKIENLSFSYHSALNQNNIDTFSNSNILNNINLNIEKGSFNVILGHNGCGKSTLAKILACVFPPSSGSVFIDSLNISSPENILNIRKKVGFVFQNPDNQIVASIVEDDVAFGLENLSIPQQEIIKKVDKALSAVDMLDFKKHTTFSLSGGQKQRVAIAGVLAMQPECIILDEPTSMLDPKGRQEVINIIKNLNKTFGITIILITHFMEEVISADRIIVMNKGCVTLDDTPLNVFKNVEKLHKLNLDVPEPIKILHHLNKNGFNLDLDCLHYSELIEKIFKIGFKSPFKPLNIIPANKPISQDFAISLENVSFIYNPNTVFEKKALNNINLNIPKSSFFGIIGHTGSGKSTLIQLFNGLLKPSCGNIFVNRKNIYENFNTKNLHHLVGVVFQYPEYQLFEETVFKDVCFGPKNMGLNKNEIEKRAINSLKLVGLNKDYYEKSPFELSGGEKRRVAIAGILAMQPDILVFDELTAGLDPSGRKNILNNIKTLKNDLNTTVVLISHSMEDICELCDNVLVLNNGSSVLNDFTENVFLNDNILKSVGLNLPETNIISNLINASYTTFPKNIFKIDQLLYLLTNNLNKC